MKKILLTIISVVLLLSNSIVSAEEQYNEDRWNLLFALDVFDEVNISDAADTRITKGEYMIYLMRLFGRYYEIYEGNSLYSDVSEDDDFYDAANIAKEMGCYSALKLNPEDNITYREAAEMLLKGMGYSKMLAADNISNVISKAKLVSMSMKKTLNMNDMAELFYSAVHAPLCKYDISFGDSVRYSTDDDQTLLSQYYDIEIIEGIVTRNEITSLYSADSLLERGIEIDDVFYGDPDNIGRDYLGYKVRAYVDYTDDKDDGKIVFVINKDTTVKEIRSEDIEAVDSRVTRLDYTVGNKTKYARISENAKVIYNGKFFGDYSAKDFMPEIGSVTLIDNNRDDVADVVIVWSYKTIFVDTVSTRNKTVYTAYNTKGMKESICLDNSDKDFKYEIFWDGEEVSFQDIKKHQVLSVAESKNTDDGYIRIELSKTEIKGKIEEINIEDSKIKIDGEWYTYIPDFTKEYNISMSYAYKFYIDSFGNAAAMLDEDNETFVYAYLYRAILDDDETAVIKVFTQDADWLKYEINYKVSYNGKKVEPSELISGKNNDTKRSGLAIDETTTDRQIIKLTTEGETVKSIETAISNAGTDEFNKFSETIYWRNQNKSFESKYFKGDNTVVFGIPSDDSENEDAYRISPTLSGDRQYSITAYGVDEYGDADVITVDVAKSTLRKTQQTCLVIDIVQALSSDETVVSMLRCSFGIFPSFDIEFDEGCDYSGIHKGDIINITINEVGKIVSYTRNYDFANEYKKYHYPTQFHSNSFMYGRIVKVDPENKRMIVDLGGDRTKQGFRFTYADLVIKRYNRKRGRVEVISSYSLEPGDYVVMDTRASYLTQVIVYDE